MQPPERKFQSGGTGTPKRNFGAGFSHSRRSKENLFTGLVQEIPEDIPKGEPDAL